ncbi:hypothetical protein [Haloferula sp.]|uniref:hypothetical protein n=1 Tax=Haloferula sp. TaxID=2497595 RepID=UPI003C73937D
MKDNVDEYQNLTRVGSHPWQDVGLFTEIVGSTRSNLELTSDLEVSDGLATNHVTLRADFSVSDVFSGGGRGQPSGMEFIPHSIAGKVVVVSDKARVHPLGLIHPANVEHRTKIDHPDAKGSIVRRTIVNNEFMEFDAGTDQDAETPTLFYASSAKTVGGKRYLNAAKRRVSLESCPQQSDSRMGL